MVFSALLVGGNGGSFVRFNSMPKLTSVFTLVVSTDTGPISAAYVGDNGQIAPNASNAIGVPALLDVLLDTDLTTRVTYDLDTG